MLDRFAFGNQLRYFRRRARDPNRGGSLTQERLTIKLAEDCSIYYSLAAVSDWERGKSHIPNDERLTLAGLVTVLGKYGGILSLAEADAWLSAGNYRPLDGQERADLLTLGINWPDLHPDNASRAAPPVFLAPPLPFHAIVGRGSVLEDLKGRLLDRETIALFAVKGLPGVGKTTIALALAHDPQIQDVFSGGIFWVGLGRDPDVFFQLSLWGRVLGFSSKELENMPAIGMRTDAIRSLLSDKKALLIIDDVWQAGNASKFQLGGKDCAHIVTTRQPKIAHSFEDASPVSVETLTPDDSILLLSSLAPQVADDYPAALRALARSSAGLPLAIVLVGNHLRKLGLMGQKRRLERALEELQSQAFLFEVEMQQAASHRHPSLGEDQIITLASVIDISLQALGDQQSRSALYSLGVFPPKPSSFSEEAALAVLDADIETLDELVDAGLVESSGLASYQIHQSITNYLRTKGIPEQAFHRFVEFVSGWFRHQAPEDARIERELDNITAAMTAAKDYGLSAAYISLAAGLYPYLEKRAHWDLVNLLLPEAIEQSGRIGDYPAQMSFYRSWGRALEQQRDRKNADRYWQKALALARDRQLDEMLVDLLNELSLAATSENSIETAHKYLVEALDTARRSSYVRGLCYALGYLGRLHNETGDYLDSIKFLDESIQLAFENNFSFVLGGLFNLRAVAARNVESADTAVDYFLKGLKYARENRRKDQVGLILTNLGEVEALRGQNAAAAAYLEEALQIVQETENKAREAHIRKDLGILAVQRGDRTAAKTYFDEALNLVESDDWLTAYIRVHRGEAFLENDPNAAEAEFEEIIENLPPAGKNRFIHAVANFCLARLVLDRGDTNRAVHLAEESIRIFSEIEHIREAEVRNWVEKAFRTH